MRVPCKGNLFYEISEQEEGEFQCQVFGYLLGLTFHRSFSSDLASIFSVIMNLHAYSADIADGFKAVKLAILYLMLTSSKQ